MPTLQGNCLGQRLPVFSLPAIATRSSVFQVSAAADCSLRRTCEGDRRSDPSVSSITDHRHLKKGTPTGRAPSGPPILSLLLFQRRLLGSERAGFAAAAWDGCGHQVLAFGRKGVVAVV